MMREGKAKVGDIELHYEDHGKPTDPAMLLIMGLGAQLIWWPDPLVSQLVDAGFRVIRYDNRDIGLSTKFASVKPPKPLRLMARFFFGVPFTPAYGLNDMAADAVGLLDALGIERAHIVGASMGGMIAQVVAATYPARTLSLTSIMSTSGRRGLPGPSRELRNRLITRRSADAPKADLINDVVMSLNLMGSPGYDAGTRRDLATRAVERSYYPDGAMRQFGAIVASGDRVKLLGGVHTPTLVIHGTADPLVPMAGGEDTARLIPGARLELIEGMGHDIPPRFISRLAELISGHAHGAMETRQAA